jgi:hypothetical protein
MAIVTYITTITLRLVTELITGFTTTDSTDILSMLTEIIYSAGGMKGTTTTSIFTMAVITWFTTGTISTTIA